MKKIYLIVVFALFCAMANAQSATQPGEKYPAYCCVMGYNALGFGKVKVQIDLGRKANNKGFDSLYESDGKKMKFKSMMGVLNYMGERGWRCINNYPITKGNAQVVHYLLEKWVSSDEEITEGLTLKEETDPEPWKPGKNDDDMY